MAYIYVLTTMFVNVASKDIPFDFANELSAASNMCGLMDSSNSNPNLLEQIASPSFSEKFYQFNLSGEVVKAYLGPYKVFIEHSSGIFELRFSIDNRGKSLKINNITHNDVPLEGEKFSDKFIQDLHDIAQKVVNPTLRKPQEISKSAELFKCLGASDSSFPYDLKGREVEFHALLARGRRINKKYKKKA